MSDKCYINGCENKPKYVIEWYSLNQHWKNPHVVYERSVCDNFEHLLWASYHEDFGGVPDGIVDAETPYTENPLLLKKVIQYMENRQLSFDFINDPKI